MLDTRDVIDENSFQNWNTELVTSASVLANSAWLLTSKLALFESPWKSYSLDLRVTNEFYYAKKGRIGKGIGNWRGELQQGYKPNCEDYWMRLKK